MRRTGLAALAALALAACSEEDRRAWVSILPISQDEEPERGPAGGPLAIASDSTAILMGADTLFTLRRLPARGPDGAPLGPRGFARAVMAPDTASVAVELTGATPAVVVWSRPRQTATVAGTFPGGAVVAMAWSPDGRLLAFDGRDREGLARIGLFDVRDTRTGRHAVVQWLARQRRSVRFQDWIDTRHARFLVSPGEAPEGGLAYVWDIERGAFLLEAHGSDLAAHAPRGRPQPGGVFSVDLMGDPTPETVALYQAPGGAPGALVLIDAGTGGVGAVTTEPLVALETLGFEKWEDAPRGATLYQMAVLGGRPTLLLALPSPVPLAILGFFQVGVDGRLQPVPVATPTGTVPAIFPDGSAGQQTYQLGLIDLDGDGSLEVVAAEGRVGAEGLALWEAQVYRWEGGLLIRAPDLDPAAVERLERLVGER